VIVKQVDHAKYPRQDQHQTKLLRGRVETWRDAPMVRDEGDCSSSWPSTEGLGYLSHRSALRSTSRSTATYCPSTADDGLRHRARLLYEVVDDRAEKDYEGTLEFEHRASPFRAVGSFRISAFQQKGSPAWWCVSSPPRFRRSTRWACRRRSSDLILEKRGADPDGGRHRSGKSTTLRGHARLSQPRQKTGHIFTLEDPIEFVFPEQKVDREPA